jgi:hypothetical protein
LRRGTLKTVFVNTGCTGIRTIDIGSFLTPRACISTSAGDTVFHTWLASVVTILVKSVSTLGALLSGAIRTVEALFVLADRRSACSSGSIQGEEGLFTFFASPIDNFFNGRKSACSANQLIAIQSAGSAASWALNTFGTSLNPT